MKKTIFILDKVITPINKASMRVASVLIFMMMILTFVDVTGRKLFRPVSGAYELTYLGLALVVFLSFGYVQSKKGHIVIGVWVDKWPKRAQAIVDAIIYFCMLLILLIMTWQMFVFAGRIQNNVTGNLGLPENIFIMICSFAVLIFALTVMLDFLKALLKVVDLKDES